MDGKMKGMIMAGMAGLCLILGIIATLGSTWLVPIGDDAEALEEMGGEGGAGLTSTWSTSETASAEQCKEVKEAMDTADEDDIVEVECDGKNLEMTVSFSDLCDAEGDDYEDDCDMASAGMIGTIGMWAGIICALMVTLTLVLPMAGIDAMDAVPEMGNKIATWGAGALMLVGMLGWYMMLPDTDSETGLGMSGWLAGAAMSTGLGSALIGQFIEADE
tara:strand:+ start:2360 stop:3013 length:654 start_codon:yes stop_codon:yes gene_type:complete